jgi:hypothetical protein
MGVPIASPCEPAADIPHVAAVIIRSAAIAIAAMTVAGAIAATTTARSDPTEIYTSDATRF